MRFHGLEPLEPNRPIVELQAGGAVLDLHNDADWAGLEIDVRARRVATHWILSQPAWQVPSLPEPAQRPTVSRLTLHFAGVTRVEIGGAYSLANPAADLALEFVEYTRLRPGIGQVRVVWENGASLTVVAVECSLRTVAEYL